MATAIRTRAPRDARASSRVRKTTKPDESPALHPGGLLDERALDGARTAEVVASLIRRVHADVGALRRIVVGPEEAHLAVRRLAELHNLVRRVVPVAGEVEAAVVGDLDRKSVV